MIKYQYEKMSIFPKSAINGLTKHLGSLRFNKNIKDSIDKEMSVNDIMIRRCKELGLEIDYNDSNLPGEKFCFSKPRKITKEQTLLGKAWLKNHFFKLNGQVRSGKNTQNISQQILAIAKNVSRFEFVGVLGVATQAWEIQAFLPIYRAYNSKGEYFDYAPVHWGQPVIMEGN